MKATCVLYLTNGDNKDFLDKVLAFNSDDEQTIIVSTEQDSVELVPLLEVFKKTIEDDLFA